MDLRPKIEELAAPLMAPIDAFIVDVQIRPGDRRKIIQLFVDTDAGITIDQCASLSRSLGEALEIQGAIADPYILEVSSPGLERPLKNLRQYRKNLGRMFRVRCAAEQPNTEFVGKLLAVEGETLTFGGGKNENYVVPFHTIIESIEELPW